MLCPPKCNADLVGFVCVKIGMEFFILMYIGGGVVSMEVSNTLTSNLKDMMKGLLCIQAAELQELQ